MDDVSTATMDLGVPRRSLRRRVCVAFFLWLPWLATYMIWSSPAFLEWMHGRGLMEGMYSGYSSGETPYPIWLIVGIFTVFIGFVLVIREISGISFCDSCVSIKSILLLFVRWSSLKFALGCIVLPSLYLILLNFIFMLVEMFFFLFLVLLFGILDTFFNTEILKNHSIIPLSPLQIFLVYAVSFFLSCPIVGVSAFQTMVDGVYFIIQNRIESKSRVKVSSMALSKMMVVMGRWTIVGVFILFLTDIYYVRLGFSFIISSETPRMLIELLFGLGFRLTVFGTVAAAAHALSEHQRKVSADGGIDAAAR